MVNFENEFSVPPPPNELSIPKKVKETKYNFCANCGLNVTEVWQENPYTYKGKRVYLCNDCMHAVKTPVIKVPIDLDELSDFSEVSNVK